MLLAVMVIGATGLRAQTKSDDDDEDGGIAPRERVNWYYLQRAYPNGIPNGARSRAVRLAHEMRNAAHRGNFSTTLSSTWQPVGPTNGDGRVEALAFDATSGTLFAGAAEGGVWRTPDLGSTWNPLTDTDESLAMGALAIDPNNPQTIYAGTGEWELAFGGPFTTQSPIYSGAGIMKSTDGGDTWTVMGLTSVAAFSRIIIDPDNSNIVWAATTNGFWRSSDAGTTWTAILADSLCSDVALDPNNHTQLYIAIANDGVFGYYDGQELAPNRLSNGFPSDSAELGRISLSASASGSTTVIYSMVANPAGFLTGVYKLNGVTWTNLSAPSSLLTEPQGYYDLTIAASPTNPNIVIAGGVDLYYSNNGGTSWSPSNIGHVDQHAVLFDPSGDGDVYVGCDGGVYYSQNNGASFSFISAGTGITQYYGIDVSQSVLNSFVGGTQDNGTWQGSGLSSWKQTFGGDGGETKFDPNNPQNYYFEVLAPQPASIYYSSSGSSIFQPSTSPAPWVMPVAVSGSTIYAGSNVITKGVNNNGTFSFNTISPNLTRGGTGGQNTIGCIGISPENSNVIWSGSNDGKIFVTTNGGSQSSWTDVSAGTSGRAVTRIMPVSNDTAYVTYSGYGAWNDYEDYEPRCNMVGHLEQYV